MVKSLIFNLGAARPDRRVSDSAVQTSGIQTGLAFHHGYDALGYVSFSGITYNKSKQQAHFLGEFHA